MSARNTLTQFERVKTYEEIKAQCDAQKLALADVHFRAGGDTLVVSGGGGRVFFNAFNGKFFGNTPDGKHFRSSESYFEEEPWFKALLNFFYVEKK